MTGISVEGAGSACAVPSALSGRTGATEAGAPARTWQGPSAPDRLAILRRAKSIAIVGASANP
ncbi:MAG: CoA-binding protein, partial [Brachybacterium tyrofermentans]